MCNRIVYKNLELNRYFAHLIFNKIAIVIVKINPHKDIRLRTYLYERMTISNE